LHNILRRSSYKAKKGKISTLSSQVWPLKILKT
jgi:hypothetical protein